MTAFYWVRHGPTHAKGAVGWTDLPADLSDTDQIARVAAYLPADAQVVSSDLSRARDTGTAIAADRMRLPDRPGLREMNYGTWENRAFDEIAKDAPELSRAFWTTPGDVAPPNGESWNALKARIAGEITDLSPLVQDRPLVVVAHFGVILTALQAATGMTAEAVFKFKIDNLSVTRIDLVPDGRFRVVTVNHHP